jgi:hypothetical protein
VDPSTTVVGFGVIEFEFVLRVVVFGDAVLVTVGDRGVSDVLTTSPTSVQKFRKFDVNWG